MKKLITIVAVNVFIVMNIMMMVRAQLDKNSPVINFVYTPVTFVQNYFSMWRGWSMFAPNPLRTNAYVDAIIKFEDGSKIIYNFPRPDDDSLIEKYVFGERYRKYMTDGLRLDNKKHLWEDGAKFVLRKIAPTHFRKKPISVTLRRRWQKLKPWDQEFIAHRSKFDKTKFKKYEYYTYKVPDDIK